ncbi:MAG: EAL domain-containing protein [Burkholderiaceae bacterium]
MKHLPSHPHLLSNRITAAKVAAWYALFAGVWVVASHVLLKFAVADPVLQGYIELANGLVFVAVTSGLIFIVAMARDMSVRKAEIKIQRLTQFYAALSQCNQAIVRCTSEEELFSGICHDAVQFGGMKMVWIGLLDQDSRQVRPVAACGDGTEFLEGIQIVVTDDSPTGSGPTAAAIREQQPVWCQDFQNDPSTAPWRESSARFGWGASAALPLYRNGVVAGVFTLYTGESNVFDQEVRSLLIEMASDISYALGNFAREAARQQGEAQLRLAAQVFAQSGEGITITDAQRNILMVNRAFTVITCYSEAEVLGKNPSLLQSGRQDKEFYQSMRTTLNKHGHWQGEMWNRRKDGSIYSEWLSVSEVRDDQGNLTNYIGIFSDLSKYKAAQDHIQHLARFDALTGLPNRVLLTDRTNQALSMAQRSHTSLALLFLDLDRFKNVNDSLGHSIGDALLVALAQRLSAGVREQDILSRLGGDEFILVLPETDAAGAAHIARILLEAMAKPYQIKLHELTITASIGIALYPDNAVDFESLSKCADIAMYRAKHDGRNNFCFYSPEMQARSVRTLQLENALRRALERNQLELHYQPQVSLRDGSIIGAEALLRWNHPELGSISPCEFIPIAEDSGQILQIGEWVLRTAARQCRAWTETVLAPFTMAVNLSALQFRHPQLTALVMQIIEQEGLPPSCIELELTESAAMDNPLAAIAVMDSLHACGIRMSIDDFGTGYSSLSYLKRFQVYKLKIDQSFVRDIAADPEDDTIVGAIISMAHSLGLQTIAEGVETEQQLAFLREQGCDEVQGYYFSKPLPAEQFEGLLRHWQVIPL